MREDAKDKQREWFKGECDQQIPMRDECRKTCYKLSQQLQYNVGCYFFVIKVVYEVHRKVGKWLKESSAKEAFTIGIDA